MTQTTSLFLFGVSCGDFHEFQHFRLALYLRRCLFIKNGVVHNLEISQIIGTRVLLAIRGESVQDYWRVMTRAIQLYILEAHGRTQFYP